MLEAQTFVEIDLICLNLEWFDDFIEFSDKVI